MIIVHRTDDPVADYLDYDEQLWREQQKLPKCDICGNPILDEHLYEINGELICQTCLDDCYKKPVEVFIYDGYDE